MKEKERITRKVVQMGDGNYYDTDEWYGENYKCPHCEDTDIWRNFKFCPSCGVMIEWEKESKFGW